MQNSELNPEETLHAERMLVIANNQASELIARAISHAEELLKKANFQTITLINQANAQAEQLINTAHLNEKKLLLKADSTKEKLLKKAHSSENIRLKEANSVENDLINNATKSEKELTKDADLLARKVIKATPSNSTTSTNDLAKDLVSEADLKAKALLDAAAIQAKDLVTEADEQAKTLVNNADDQARDLVSEADEQAKDLVREAAVQAKDLVKVAAFQAKDLISEAADQTKQLVREAANQARELITEAAKIYIENKMNFLNTAAHELRTPVTSMTFALELAEKQDSRGLPVTVKFLKQIRAPLERLSKLLSNLIEMSRMERKVILLDLKKTDLVTLIDECIGEFRTQNHDFIFQFYKPDQKIEIYLDPLRIHQVLSNIIENAIKYCGKDTIEISLQIFPEIARVELRDRGIGISKEQQSKLFLPFHRGTSDSIFVTSGLGLGLALCHEIIKLHKGKIGLAKTESQGCTFYFELPYPGEPN